MPEKSIEADIINGVGTSLVSASKIYIRNDKIAMDGKIMGSMPGQFYITPLNLYKFSTMVDFAFIRQAMKLLRKGKREYLAAQAEKK